MFGLIGAAALVAGCTALPGIAHQEQRTESTLLVSSSPAAGSAVAETVDALELHFNPPARLVEVTVTGPGGAMPMMVHAVGEVADYSLPLSGLGPGSYTVNWRATAQGREYRGSYRFSVHS
jgi:methionine-rich copper-binding protein CopC